MFIAAMYIWKHFVQILHRWLKELGSLSGSNGGSRAKSIFTITDTAKERCEILITNTVWKDDRKKPGSIRILVAHCYAILLFLVTESQLQSHESYNYNYNYNYNVTVCHTHLYT